MPTPKRPSIAKSVNPAQVDHAHQKVREFWNVGQRSLRAHATYARDGSKGAEAERLKAKGTAGITWSAETLRVARRFASRCDRPRLERMLKEARQRAIPVGYVILVTLFEVTDDRVRKQLWKEMLAAGGWSKRQVESAIRQRNAPRRRRAWAGRTRRKPRNLEDAADQLAQSSAAFERLFKSIEASLLRFARDQQRKIESSRRAMDALGRSMHRKRRKT